MSLVGFIVISLYVLYLDASNKRQPVTKISNVYLSCIDNSTQKDNPSLVVLIDSVEAVNLDSMSQLTGIRLLKLSLGKHFVNISTRSGSFPIVDTVDIMDSSLEYQFCVVYNGNSNGYGSNKFSVIFHDLLKE